MISAAAVPARSADGLSGAGRPASPTLALHRWVDRYQHALTIPDHVLSPALREHEARTFQVRGLTESLVVGDLRAAAERDLVSYARRRQVEDQVVEYLRDHGFYPRLADRMAVCRRSGQIGRRECADGGVKHVIAWDQKCGLTRLCPDEAREEQVRLVERYAPAIVAWQKAVQGRQVQYVVLTWPNIPAGQLAEYKRRMLREVAAWLKRGVCKSVKGALVSQEDPLSAAHDWNLHANLVLLVHGRFDWSAARRDWYKHTRALFPAQPGKPLRSFNTHFENVQPPKIARSVLELVKYNAKHVTEGKDLDAGQDRPAPGLIEWPHERFSEWWEAGLGFRRTRSYGALFRVAAPKFEAMRTEWVGRVSMDSGQYVVRIPGVGGINLIQADNSGFSHTAQVEGGVHPPRVERGPPDGGCAFFNQ